MSNPINKESFIVWLKRFADLPGAPARCDAPNENVKAMSKPPRPAGKIAAALPIPNKTH